MSFALPDTPTAADLRAGRPTLWLNPGLTDNGIGDPVLPIRPDQVAAAEANWQRLVDLHQFSSGHMLMLCGSKFESHGRFPSELWSKVGDA